MAGGWPRARTRAAHDGHRLAWLLRVARRSGALSAHEHHVRHHAVARCADQSPARSRDGHQPACVERPGGVVGPTGWRMTRPRDVSLSEQKSAFVEYLRHNRNTSPNTVRAYEADLSRLVQHLALRHTCKPSELRLGHFDYEGVRGHLEVLHEDGISRSSAARHLATLRSFARYLTEEGLLESDPTQLVGTPRRDKTLPAHLGAEDMTRLLEAPSGDTVTGRRDRAILELFYASGLRLAELCGIDLEDISLNRRTVRVLGKGSKERYVPFNGATE